MEGAKKYSPPLETMKSGMLKLSETLRGFKPVVMRFAPLSCPMTGSSPGALTVLLMGNLDGLVSNTHIYLKYVEYIPVVVGPNDLLEAETV